MGKRFTFVSLGSSLQIMARWRLLLLVTLFPFLSLVHAIPIDNEVVGEPHVACGEAGISIQISTRNPFLGRIFVKGKAYNERCSSSGRFEDRNLHPSFLLSFNECGMYRNRMLNPRGMMYSTVLIVSFHPIFITKVDRAYRIQCFYGEIQKPVSAFIDVSMLPTTELADISTMPRCMYSVRQGSVDGAPVAFAQVGDKVVHRWECDSNIYAFLVKSCYVEDGRGTTISVVDDLGCVLDPILLSTVTYDPQIPLAFAESHVFKFADFPRVNFMCQIQICLKGDGSCASITPPNCLRKTRRSVKFGNGTNDKGTTKIDTTYPEMDVRDEMMVFELDEHLENYKQQHDSDDDLKFSVWNSGTGNFEPVLQTVHGRCIISGEGLLAVTVALGVVLVILCFLLCMNFQKEWKFRFFYRRT